MQRQNRRNRTTNSMSTRSTNHNTNMRRETRPVKVVTAPVTQTAPPRLPAPVTYKEPKYIDTAAVATSVSTGLVAASMTVTTNGTSDINRVGDQIELHSLEFRWIATVASADGSNLLRLIIIQWWADDTTDTPSATKILAGGTSQPYNSPFNHDNSSKFVVLYDKILSTSTYYPVKHDSVMIPLDRSPVRKVIKYAAGAGTGNNNIYACFVSDSGPSPQPTVDYYCRVNYYDT